MTLIEVMKNAEPGDVIGRTRINTNDEKVWLNDYFVIVKGNRLVNLDECDEIMPNEMCDDNWEIKNEQNI